MQRRPDATLAERELDWAAKISLDAGLKPTIEYFDALLREADSDLPA